LRTELSGARHFNSALCNKHERLCRGAIASQIERYGDGHDEGRIIPGDEFVQDAPRQSSTTGGTTCRAAGQHGELRAKSAICMEIDAAGDGFRKRGIETRKSV
jgi:hypothetical protein